MRHAHCLVVQDKESGDPNRVGGPTNHLLEGGGLSTVIGKGRDGDGAYMLNRLHTRRSARRGGGSACMQVHAPRAPAWACGSACSLCA